MKTAKRASPESVFKRRTSQAHANQRRRALKYGYVLPFTLAELREWIGKDLFQKAVVRCDYCRAAITEATFCLDHIMPVGRRCDDFTWRLDNLCLCCERCNQCKDRLTGEEFSQLARLVSHWPPQAQTNLMARLRAGARRVAGR